MSRHSSRIRGHHVVAGFIVLATLGVIGGYLTLKQHPSPTAIIDIVNLDGDTAVVIRDTHGPDERSFISLFDREHGERWGALIPTYAQTHPARRAVAATEEVVFVRSVGSGELSFFAFGGARGQKLGRIDPFERDDPDDDSTLIGLSRIGTLADAGDAFEFSGDDGRRVAALGFNLKDGTLKWRAELGPLSIERAWLRTDHIVLATANEILVLKRETGVIAGRVPATGAPCVLDERVYANRASDGRLVAIDLKAVDLSRPPSISEIASGPVARAQLHGMCGHRGKRVLMAVRDPSGSAMVAVDTHTNAVVWRIAIDGAWIADDIVAHTPDRVPLSGALTRYVPILFSADASTVRVAMIDTDEGRVVWRSNAPGFRVARLFSADSGHFLYLPERAVLAVFDGTDGVLRAARSVEGFAPIWPRQVAGDSVWVFRQSTWAVLDAGRLTPRAGQGARDVGSDIREEFALEMSLKSGSDAL